MSRPTRAPSLRALAALAVALLLGLTIQTGAAQAHDVLVSSSPAEGETLTESPAEVRLTFNNDILDLNAAIVVTDADGTVLTEDAPVVDGTEVALPLPDGVPAGVWTVTWRVVSSDGHPISGTYDFTVDTPEVTTTVPTEPASTEPASTEPSEDATTDDAETSDPSATPTESATPTGTGGGNSGTGPGAVVSYVVVALAVIGGAAALVIRRLRSGS